MPSICHYLSLLGWHLKCLGFLADEAGTTESHGTNDGSLGPWPPSWVCFYVLKWCSVFGWLRNGPSPSWQTWFCSLKATCSCNPASLSDQWFWEGICPERTRSDKVTVKWFWDCLWFWFWILIDFNNMCDMIDWFWMIVVPGLNSYIWIATDSNSRHPSSTRWARTHWKGLEWRTRTGIGQPSPEKWIFGYLPKHEKKARNTTFPLRSVEQGRMVTAKEAFLTMGFPCHGPTCAAAKVAGS